MLVLAKGLEISGSALIHICESHGDTTVGSQIRLTVGVWSTIPAVEHVAECNLISIGDVNLFHLLQIF